MRWFEYKMEVDDLHASDDLKAKLLAMQSQQAVLAPAAKTVTRKQPEVPAHKKVLHFPSSRVWKGLAACAAFCVVAGGAASVLHLGVIGVGGAKSSGPATFSSREATGFSMENSVSSYAMASAPAVADSLTVTGATLAGRGVNRCTLAVSKAGEVCVTGRKYVDSTIILRRAAANLPPNAQDNELTVTDATLVSPDRAAAVADRVLDYYAQRYEQTFRMIAGDEKLADRLIVQSFGGEMVRGVLTKLEFDLTGGFVADAKVVGRRLSGTAAAYAGDEIRAGERSLI